MHEIHKILQVFFFGLFDVLRTSILHRLTKLHFDHPKACHVSIQLVKTTNWEQDLYSIKKKFQYAGYPLDIFRKPFMNLKIPEKPDTIIPVNWFDARHTVTISVPYCKTNEQQSCAFIKKTSSFHSGTLISLS